MQATDKFQGKCLLNTEGWEFMDFFDVMPHGVKERLRNSPFNICAACVHQAAYETAHAHHENWPSEQHYFSAISDIEAQIMAEERHFLKP